MEQGLSKNTILSELSRSTHGKLSEYLPVGLAAVREEPEFLAHLIAWNHAKGQVRDSKVALPVIGLKSVDSELRDNAAAHIALLDPRNLVRAAEFAGGSSCPQILRRTVHRYLRSLEENWAKWQRKTVQHRRSMKRLYALFHVKPSTMADAILFKGEAPPGTVFAAIKQIAAMSPIEAAGTIIEKGIPFLVAKGILGDKMKDPVVVQALIERMSPTDVVTNSAMLKKLGVETVPALRAAYENALAKAARSKKNVLKATRAAESIGDQKLATKLKAVQEQQLDSIAVEGDWLVLADKSPSMDTAIPLARKLAALLAKVAKGKVHLVFFDDAPRYMDATGMTYEDLLAKTRLVDAGGGGTSIGCGVLAIIDKKIEVDGIAIVSDMQENTHPRFSQQYKVYSETMGKQIPVYLYRCSTRYTQEDLTVDLKRSGIDYQEFDLRHKESDFYSLPNMVATMRTNRYSLIDEIMATPLKTVEMVLPLRERAVA